MKVRWLTSSVLLIALLAVVGVSSRDVPVAPVASASVSFEVWALDQSNTMGTGGGLLYIWEGDAISKNAAKATPEVIELSQAAIDAGCSVATRPHMAVVNSSNPPSHVIIANVGSGDIFFMDIATRSIVGCVNTVGGFNGAGGAVSTHAAMATPDDTMVIVDDIMGQSLHKIQTDYSTNSFALVETLSLAPFASDLGTPHVRPICHDYTADSRFAYVTLAAGGLLVVDVGSADGITPMTVAKVYPQAVVPGTGCGAFRLDDGRMLTNGESGPAGGDDFLFVFDTSGASDGIFPDPVKIDLPGEDTHGIAVCVNHKGQKFAITAMRVSHHLNIVDLQTYEVKSHLSMARPWSMAPSPDIAGMMDGKMFVSLRGPKPLTAINALEDPARTPGVAVMNVHRNCNTWNWGAKDLASMKDDSRTAVLADGTVVTAADPHGLVIVPR